MHTALAAAPSLLTVAPPAALAPFVPLAALGTGPAIDEPPRGCGWFESSLDLSRGLAVVEHAAFDALATEVPLAWQLAPWL